jgi:isoleucyl-tRNA synthetase
VETYDWTGVYPELHSFCSADLSAFYFDIRKDTLYCDRPDSLRRRAARTVLDHLHRCLTIWLAPVLCFTAEEAWSARFGNGGSVHLQTFPEIPPSWHDTELAARWARLRDIRREVTTAIEQLRACGEIGASLQAAVSLGLPAADSGLLPTAEWQDLAIVSSLDLMADAPVVSVSVTKATGSKCTRCWRVLPEVGSVAAHPALCLRCADAVQSGLVCRPAPAV